MSEKKVYKVWIYDKESGCNQPMTCTASSVQEARAAGNKYINAWNLLGASVTKVELAEKEAGVND